MRFLPPPLIEFWQLPFQPRQRGNSLMNTSLPDRAWISTAVVTLLVTQTLMAPEANAAVPETISVRRLRCPRRRPCRRYGWLSKRPSMPRDKKVGTVHAGRGTFFFAGHLNVPRGVDPGRHLGIRPLTCRYSRPRHGQAHRPRHDVPHHRKPRQRRWPGVRHSLTKTAR